MYVFDTEIHFDLALCGCAQHSIVFFSCCCCCHQLWILFSSGTKEKKKKSSYCTQCLQSHCIITVDSNIYTWNENMINSSSASACGMWHVKISMENKNVNHRLLSVCQLVQLSKCKVHEIQKRAIIAVVQNIFHLFLSLFLILSHIKCIN